MNFEKFFERTSLNDTKISYEEKHTQKHHLLNNEALFQLPLISLIVLLMAKDRRKPKVSEIGQLVGECIENSIPGFKGSAQHVGWSANLRVRSVKAISFLEITKLIEVNNRKGKIQISELGKKVIEKAQSKEDDLACQLSEIARAYRNICVSKQLDLELE
jgi:hypothetical protein